MSNRNRVSKPKYIEAEDMAADFNGPWLNIAGVDNLSFQVKWATADARTIPVAATDNVVAATKTWNIAAGAFTAADDGGSFTITGTDGGNDGTYTIDSVTDSNTVVSVEAPNANETFDGVEVLTLQQLDPTGTLRIEASNDGPVIDASTRQAGPSGQLGASTIYTEATTNPAADEGTHIIPLAGRAEVWARLCYDATTGGGILDAGFAGKGI